MIDQTFCPVCRSPRTCEVKRVRDSYHYLPGQWRLADCAECGVAFLVDAPDEQGIGAFYPAAAYYTHAAPPCDHPVITAINDYHYGKCSDWQGALLHRLMAGYVNMFPRRNKAGVTRLLDFGCGNGSLMRRYEAYGFTCEGFDVDEGALRKVREQGFVVHSGHWQSIPDGWYDVIVLNQVLEHLHHPIKVLRFLRRHLVPGGQLIVSVPNRSCADYAILLDSWTSFQAPTHLFQFKLKSLRHMLDETGFDIDEVRYPSSLGTLKPGYIRANLANLFRLEGHTAGSWLRAMQFLASSLLAVMPALSAAKRIRVTVACTLRAGL